MNRDNSADKILIRPSKRSNKNLTKDKSTIIRKLYYQNPIISPKDGIPF